MHLPHCPPASPAHGSMKRGHHGSVAATNLRVPHPLRSWQRMGYATIADPTLRKRREGWGTRRFVAFCAVANTHGGFIEGMFLVRKPHTRFWLEHLTGNPGISLLLGDVGFRNAGIRNFVP